jgi:hypothetical protein
MHPVISEHELWVHDRRRQELIMRAQRDREISALMGSASSPQGSGASHRHAIDALSTLASGWLGRRRPQVGHPRPTRSAV